LRWNDLVVLDGDAVNKLSDALAQIDAVIEHNPDVLEIKHYSNPAKIAGTMMALGNINIDRFLNRKRGNRYQPHQGARERARRLKRLERTT
jgi:hypothetical protein